MAIQICQVAPDRLHEYATVSSAFQVTSVLRVETMAGGLGGLALVEEPVFPSYQKNYDGAGGEEGVLGFSPGQLDLTAWGIFLAYRGRARRPAGGAMVGVNTAGVHMLEGSPELAVLWDIRVRPDLRGQGVGKALFRHAATWARERGCTQLKIETQNVNVPACRFYARQGAELGAIHRYGYAGCPAVASEAMLLWYLDLR